MTNPIKIDIEGIDPLQAAIQRLAKAMANMAPFWQEAGEELLNSHRQRYMRQVGPDNQRWADLQESTKKQKARQGFPPNQILYATGALYDSFNIRPSAADLLLGISKGYGTYHQFGTGRLPVRAFLGVSQEDGNTLMKLLQDYLEEASGR